MRVVLRADADERTGVGHVMRAFAIAQALRDERIAVELATFRCTPGIIARYDDEHVHVRRLPSDDPLEVVAGLDAGDWVVLDGYQFDAAYVDACERSGVRALVVDDDAARHPIAAAALLNPNLHAAPAAYASWRCGDLLLGTRWTPLRREFREPAVALEPERRVLVTMGGSDPPGTTLAILEPLARALPDVTFDIVVGSANSRRDEIQQVGAHFGSVNVHTDVRNMTSLMRGAAAAISASGSTAWELASTDVPMLLVSLAPNQRPVADALATAGAALDLGEHDRVDPAQVVVAVRALLDDPSRARKMATLARRIVDGRGAQRIARYLQTGDLALGDPT